MPEIDPHSLPGAVYDTAPDQWTISLGDRGLHDPALTPVAFSWGRCPPRKR